GEADVRVSRNLRPFLDWRSACFEARGMNSKHAILLVTSLLVIACGDTSGSGVNGSDDSGTDSSIGHDAGKADSTVPQDSGADTSAPHDGSAVDSGGNAGDDGGPDVGSDASHGDAHVADTGAPDAGTRGACLAACEAAHPEGAQAGQLLLNDCCGGSCASTCTSGPCFSGSGFACESCALAPLKAGTCGAHCRDPQA